MTDIRTIGFVGLGNMGFPMAGHLAAAGFKLVVADAAPGVVDRFVAEHGGSAAPSLATMGAAADVVVTMLPAGAVVRQVALGPGDCIADGMSKGAVLVDMSTSNPVDTRSLGDELAKRGIAMVDAPVAGGVVFAKDATLSITAGGDPDHVTRCRPLFEAMARDVVHCGPLGAGHAMKALNNFINASALITAFEALAIGKRFGLDPDIMLESMTAAATGRNNPIEKKVKPYIADPDHVTGMALALLAKDVGIAADTARSVGAFAPIVGLCSALWHDAAHRFGGDRDQIDVARLWLDDSGS
ncbi:MAG: NAD(P)-dependent oxidoreductase [Alphaproteobacteria bacterium]|nr:NAD(P)-dependent oxidoreductase [Alphaproteobacteria bacterium]